MALVWYFGIAYFQRKKQICKMSANLNWGLASRLLVLPSINNGINYSEHLVDIIMLLFMNVI